MLMLREYRHRADRLADHLPWAALVAPGVVLNKDGSFQRTLAFRGPDLESSTEAELIAVSARANNVLKGKKDRVVPVGARALAWIDKYLEDVRPDLACGADDGTLFLSAYGQALGPARVAEIARECIYEAGIGKKGACHIFRHTCATLMLEGGADVRMIQALLGHTDLKSTELYTHVSIKALKAIHTATHPARPITNADRYVPDGVTDTTDTIEEIEALFDALDREAAQDPDD